MDANEAAKAEWVLSALGFKIPPGDAAEADGGNGRAVDAGAGAVDATAGVADSAAGSAQAAAGKSGNGAAGSDEAVPDWAAARQGWETAGGAVAGQIEALRKAILEKVDSGEYEDETLVVVLRDIAGNVLTQITAELKHVETAVAVGDGGLAEVRKSGPKAVEPINQCLEFITTDAMVEECDANPFGVSVSIRGTLEPALQQMATVLQAAATH